MNTRAKLLYQLFFENPAEGGRKCIQNPSRWPTDEEINAVLPFLVIVGTPVNAVAASAILTGTALGVKASAILTAAGQATAGKTVTIGENVYEFVAALSEPAVPYEVKLGDDASGTLDNLIAAINGDEGAGTVYGEGTEAHPDVTAAAGAGDTMDVTAIVAGTDGNAIAKAEDDDNLDWDGSGAYLTGGVDGIKEGDTVTIGTTIYTFVEALSDPAEAYEVLIGASVSDTLDNLIAAITYDDGEGTNEGVKYGEGTEAHPDVTAAAGAGDTMNVTALVKGVAGNSIAKAETSDGLDWDGTGAVLTGGVNGTVGTAGEFRMDASYIYSLLADNTISDANWERTARASY